MLPDFESMLIPYLHVLDVGGESSTPKLVQRIASRFHLLPIERQDKVFLKRLTWTVSYLKESGFIFVTKASRTVWITRAGAAFLKKYPKECNRFDLALESASFARFIKRTDQSRENGRLRRKAIREANRMYTDNTGNHPIITHKLNRFFNVKPNEALYFALGGGAG